MKLSDIRRATVKKQLRVKFKLPNGMECIVDEHGLAKVPELKVVPDFDLEEALTTVQQFQIETVVEEPAKSKVQHLPLAEFQKLMAVAGGSASALVHDHDE